MNECTHKRMKAEGPDSASRRVGSRNRKEFVLRHLTSLIDNSILTNYAALLATYTWLAPEAAYSRKLTESQRVRANTPALAH